MQLAAPHTEIASQRPYVRLREDVVKRPLINLPIHRLCALGASDEVNADTDFRQLDETLPIN